MAVLSDVFRSMLGASATTWAGFRHAFTPGDGEGSRDHGGRTLLYGAGWAGVIVANSAQRDPEPGITPVGFLDDDLDLRGSRAAGLPIFGDVSAMAAARRRTGASSLLIALPYSAGADLRRVLDAATRTGLSVHMVPSRAELPDGIVEAGRIRSPLMDDLLRGSASAPSTDLQSLVRDQAIMVTGAGGQVGAELARRLLALRPTRIVLVERSKHRLRGIEDELRGAAPVEQGSTAVSAHVLDISDGPAVSALIQRSEPVSILHAATLPQPAGHPEEAARITRVNIGGTRALIDAAVHCQVERFLLVSSDDAPGSSSTTGASMRVAEMLVRDAALRSGDAFVSARMGQLGRPGEGTIERLRSQLEDGGLVTVSASEPRCYPMTVAEASGLILEAAALGGCGTTYRLDRGAPLRVGDLARDLIRLSGRDPDDVPIRIVGRPVDDDPRHERTRDVASTPIPRLMRSTARLRTPDTLRADVDRFLALARDGRSDLLHAELVPYVRSADEPGALYVDESGYRPAVTVPVRTSTSDPGQTSPRPTIKLVSRMG